MDVKFKSNSSIVIKGMEKLKNTSIKTCILNYMSNFYRKYFKIYV